LLAAEKGRMISESARDRRVLGTERAVVRSEVHDLVGIGIDVVNSKNGISTCKQQPSVSLPWSRHRTARERTGRRHSPTDERNAVRSFDRPILVVVIVDFELINVRVTIEVSGDGRVVALEDLVGIVGLVAHRIDFSERHVAD
jgi:hypothetical protein